MLEVIGGADPATLKLIICLEEQGRAYHFRALDLDRLENWTPAHRALAPQGEVPVLVEGERALSDATIALLYLADSQPPSVLLPSDPVLHYQIQALDDVLDSALLAGVNLLGWHASTDEPARAAHHAALAAVPGRAPVAGWSAVWRDAETDRLKRAEEKVADGIVRLERSLGAREWLVGGGYTIADINAFALLEGMPALYPALAGKARAPRLAAWLERVRARPAVRRALACAGRPGGKTRYAPPQ